MKSRDIFIWRACYQQTQVVYNIHLVIMKFETIKFMNKREGEEDPEDKGLWDQYI